MVRPAAPVKFFQGGAQGLIGMALTKSSKRPISTHFIFVLACQVEVPPLA